MKDQWPKILLLAIFPLLFACGSSHQNDSSTDEQLAASSNETEQKTSDSNATSLNNAKNDDQKKTSVITENDGDWSKQYVSLANTPEAEWMIRSGDIDNLGFGWDERFTPFSGKSTNAHGFPWDAKAEDASGTDRIMVPSSYKPGSSEFGGDGYSGTKRPDNDPRPITLLLTPIKSADIKAASLQLFVDDFQSPIFKTKFQVKLDGQRFIEMEKILNVLEQTGPVGKVINIKLPDEFLPMLRTDSLSILIDDPTTGAADGFAIDFVKLLLNPKALVNTGTVTGMIIDKNTRKPISNATAEVKNYGTTQTDNEGKFSLANIPAGINIVSGSAAGYASAQSQVDVIVNETSREITIELSPSEKIVFNNKTMQEGDVLVMKNIQFELGSATLTTAGKLELDKLVAFMQQHPKVEILLSGHTSTDGTAVFNKTLSFDRVKSCKLYLNSKNIDEGRIETIGYGSEKPIVPNDSEKNRAKNRRVEMKITKL